MIYDEDKMKQKVVYPTEQTPSYADWALFKMGKELEEAGAGGVEYTAGSGISISEENVISNSAQPDVNKAYVDGVDLNLQQQIDAITASSDVKDIVGTYAELQAYDTTTLSDNDIIKVLVDSTHNDAMGYYRWVITEGVGAWTYIGSEGPYYTKSQADVLLNDKLDDDFGNADVGSATAGQVLTVNSSANGVEFADIPKELPAIASGDAGKVLQVNAGETGAEWASLVAGGGYEYYDVIVKNLNLSPGSSASLEISGFSTEYDYIIISSSADHYIIHSKSFANASKANIIAMNGGNTTYSISVSFYVYRKIKAKSLNIISVIGSISTSCMLIPPGGSSGQVFKKTGSSYAQGNWKNINEVPTPVSGDDGKVLTANNGAFSWVTPSGGGSGKTRVISASDISDGDIFIGSITVEDTYTQLNATVIGVMEVSSGVISSIIASNDTITQLVSFNYPVQFITDIEGYKI